MENALFLALVSVLAACSSDESRGASSALADEYSARRLSTSVKRFVLYKRSYAHSACAYIVVEGTAKTAGDFVTPDGWQVIKSSLDKDRPDCFTLDPFAISTWPAEGSGTIDFAAALDDRTPCGVDVHGVVIAYSSQNGQPRPMDLPSDNERFDADGLSIDNSCN
jgi:hypothetical protein